MKKNSATFKDQIVQQLLSTVTIPMFPSILKFLKQNRDH
jgi:hypothetical protein